MCEKCNEALMAAATAANLLADAAKKLYDINASKEATTLAKAAAELFQEPRESGEVGTAAQTAPSEDKPAAKLPESPDTHQESFTIDEKTGIVYINGVAIGRAVLVRRPTKH